MHQPPKKPKLCCPECGSDRIWKDGMRYTNSGEVQRCLCRSCGFRFSESTQGHKTKDILYVKQLLGHKNTQNTLIYITTEKALFQHGSEEEFHIKVAQKPEEIKALLEAGFDYVLQKDGLAFFRKRK